MLNDIHSIIKICTQTIIHNQLYFVQTTSLSTSLINRYSNTVSFLLLPLPSGNLVKHSQTPVKLIQTSFLINLFSKTTFFLFLLLFINLNPKPNKALSKLNHSNNKNNQYFYHSNFSPEEDSFMSWNNYCAKIYKFLNSKHFLNPDI